MRSVILDTDVKACGICGSQEPYIEYKELEGECFIYCKKCHTITFFKALNDPSKQSLIENEMNLQKTNKKEFSPERIPFFYSSTIASTGQDSAASFAESINSSGISPIMFSAKPSAFKSNTSGQIAAQVPHPMQFSLTL